jgi:IS605 OrfB family transposase
MRRACKVTLKYLTKSKKQHISALLQAYRGAVQFYINRLWKTKGGLNKETLALLKNTRLSERYKSNALKQALEIVIGTKRAAKVTGKQASKPIFNGFAILDAKFVSVEKGKGSFDLVIRLSSLHKGYKITIPTKKTSIINKWIFRGGKFIQGCALSENDLVVWVELPIQTLKKEGKVIGIDIGNNKLIADSDGKFYGTDFIAIRDKVKRREPGSKGKHQAISERDHYIDKIVKQLPWEDLRVLGVEDLKNVKKGKSKNRNKQFRKAMAPWTYRHVLNRIKCLAEENRVRLLLVDPANTSRTCPACGGVSKNSRKGENFICVFCNHKGDADTIGAQNVLARTLLALGSVESPKLPKESG